MNKPRILLAEDNSTDQYIIKKMLDRLLCDVDVVDNGFEAVDAVRRQRYDLVFMDQKMPGLTGIEATRMIRGLPEMEKLPIVCITAYTEVDAAFFLNAGMNDFLSKPVAIYKFDQMLRKWVFRYNSPYQADSEAV